MSSAWQALLVVVIVAGAAAFVVWRVVRPWFATSGKPGCASCASGNPCADTPSTQQQAPDVHPLVLIKTKSR
jgi:hypothetical protein